MSLRDTETAQVAGLVVIFPLTFISGAFTPIAQMKWWLRPVARNQPFTFMVDAMRGLTQGGPVGHAVLMATVWMVGMTVVFAAMAVHRYRQG
jgi:ABC-type multidrug transport system permease subunit